MKYLLERNISGEGTDYKSFSSLLTKEELIAEFDELWKKTKPYNSFDFQNLSIYRGSNRYTYDILTLDDFWEQHL